jgi:hypothetical protein
VNATTLGQSALARVDLVVAQGATNRYAFRYLTGDRGYETPVDLSTWSARAQIRRSVSAETVWLTVSTDSDSIELDADGNVRVTISHSATEGADWDNRDQGVWDLELTSADQAERIRLVEGAVSVSHDVTRDA